jgi:hypothetical protein
MRHTPGAWAVCCGLKWQSLQIGSTRTTKARMYTAGKRIVCALQGLSGCAEQVWEGSKVMRQDKQLAQVCYICIIYADLHSHLQQQAFCASRLPRSSRRSCMCDATTVSVTCNWQMPCKCNLEHSSPHKVCWCLLHYERRLLMIVLHLALLQLQWILSDNLVVLFKGETICDPYQLTCRLSSSSFKRAVPPRKTSPAISRCQQHHPHQGCSLQRPLVPAGQPLALAAETPSTAVQPTDRLPCGNS